MSDPHRANNILEVVRTALVVNIYDLFPNDQIADGDTAECYRVLVNSTRV